MDLRLSDEQRGDLLILKVCELRLDASTAPALREGLISKIEGGHHTLILDLADVKFMDSSALGALIAAVKKLGPVGTIAIAAMSGPVARLFKLTRMERVFSIHETVDDAVLSLTA